MDSCASSSFQVLVAPPLFRHRPFWYQRNLSQVAERFSAVLSSDAPPNLMLLPSFSSQDLCPDGVFLTPVAGLHYVLQLFDQTDKILQSATSGTDQQLVTVKESVRQYSDRVAYLENRHSGLQRQVDLKSAQDAEFSDWMVNRSEEDWLVVTGLPRLNNSNDWQDNARRQVADIIKLVLHANRTNLNFKVLYVSNPHRFQPNRPPTYNVRMDSVHSSSCIRDLFSGFFRHNRPVSRPPPLKGVSIRNKITPDTKIRISILHQFGRVFTESNNGSFYKVCGFVSRPTLITIPPKNSTTRQRTYTFMQAVTLLPATFSDEHLTQIFQVVSNQQPGKLQSLFVVLNDDDRDRCLELVRLKRASAQPQASHQPQPQAQPVSSASFHFGSFGGGGAGMDLQGTSVIEALCSPPPPPPPEPSAHPSADPSLSDQDSGDRGSRHHSPATKDKSKVKDKDRDRSRSKKSSRGTRRRRRSSSSSSSSSAERSRKKAKKSKKKRRRSPSDSSSSSGSASTASSRGSRHTKKSSDKDRTRER